MNTLGPSVPVQSAKSNARGEGLAVDGAGFADAFDGAFSALGPRPAPSTDARAAPAPSAAPASGWAETGPQPAGSKQLPSQAAKTPKRQIDQGSSAPSQGGALLEDGSRSDSVVTHAPAAASAAQSMPRADGKSRAETLKQDFSQASKPPSGQGASVNGEGMPGVATQGHASPIAPSPIAPSPEMAPESLALRGTAIEAAPAVKGGPSARATQGRDGSNAPAAADAALSAAAAKPDSRSGMANHVPKQAGKPAVGQAAFVNPEVAPGVSSPGVASLGAASPKTPRENAPLRGAASSVVPEGKGVPFVRAPQAPATYMEAVSPDSAAKVGPGAETLRQNPLQTGKPAVGQGVSAIGPGASSVASADSAAPLRGAAPRAVPEAGGASSARTPGASAVAGAASPAPAGKAESHIEGSERTPGQGGLSADETPVMTPESLETVPSKGSEGHAVRGSGPSVPRQEAAGPELKGQFGLNNEKPSGVSPSVPLLGGADSDALKDLKRPAGLSPQEAPKAAMGKTALETAAPVRHNVASTEALLKGDTRRGVEVLGREARTPTNLFAGGALSAGPAKATGKPEPSSPIASPVLERGTLARISFDQRLAQASAQVPVARPSERGTSGSSGASLAPEVAASGSGALTPTFDPRPGIVSPVVVESRLGPALIRDLQQQFTSLDEGTSRTVELRLDPPELGRVTVRISMVGDEARVAFTAAHGTAREALEVALPKLREMFEQAGLSLGDAQVGSGPGQDSRGRGRSSEDPVAAKGERTADRDLAEGTADSKGARVNSPTPGRLTLRV